jgi:hypothetical protein
MDIQQIMQLLAAGQQQGLAPPVAPPDFNSILQQHLVNQQAEAAAQGNIGAGPPMGLGDPTAMYAQQMQNMMAQGGQPAPMGFGNMQQPQPQLQAPTQPAGQAQLPGGGLAGALRMAPPPQGGPAAY